MKAFEVQVRRSDRWETDSTYDDRELAKLRARQVDSKDRGAPVRVVEEVFVEKTQKYVLRTVYSDNKSQKNAPAKVGESRQTRTETAITDQPSGKKELKTTPGQEPANRRKSLSTGVLFGILVLIVGLGIGTMIALEHFLKIT
jgi:hypothetical protein